MFSDALLKRPENIQEFASGELDKHYIVLYTDIAVFSMWGAWENMNCTLVAEWELNVEINHFYPSLLEYIMANIIYNTDGESDMLQVLYTCIRLFAIKSSQSWDHVLALDEIWSIEL